MKSHKADFKHCYLFTVLHTKLWLRYVSRIEQPNKVQRKWYLLHFVLFKQVAAFIKLIISKLGISVGKEKIITFEYYVNILSIRFRSI